MLRKCEHHDCEETEDLHLAYGYDFFGYFCAEHCPNKNCGEGCDHWEEHEREKCKEK